MLGLLLGVHLTPIPIFSIFPAFQCTQCLYEFQNPSYFVSVSFHFCQNLPFKCPITVAFCTLCHLSKSLCFWASVFFINKIQGLKQMTLKVSSSSKITKVNTCVNVVSSKYALFPDRRVWWSYKGQIVANSWEHHDLTSLKLFQNTNDRHLRDFLMNFDFLQIILNK